MTEFFVFRHGETDWNRERRFQGHTDIPLNEEGVRQARALARQISSCGLEAIVSSDLVRARVTAEIVNENLRLPLSISPALRECSLGVVEGLPRERLAEVCEGDAWERWLSLRPEDDDFGFPDGESKSAHLARLTSFLGSYTRSNPDLRRVGVSTHGGGLRRLIHNCDGAPSEAIAIPNCALYRVMFHHESSRWIYGERIEFTAL